jgi:predicted alpha/beta hydrolase family esterase
VAYGLGSILVAAWAAFSRHTDRVQGALLVAPADVESHNMKINLTGWTPILRQVLPFRSILVGSDSDPQCSLERAQGLARDWGCEWLPVHVAGQINVDPFQCDWPQGHALLKTLLKD